MNELDLFLAALAITDPAERAAFLERECAGQPDLNQRIAQLLAGNERSRHPLDEPPVLAAGAVQFESGGDATADFHALAHPGVIIAGKYTLLEPIGEGGMGSVWRAKQTEPVKRHVAIKLIKAGMDSRQVLARFEAERQALAIMDHEHIAKVLDGGLHEGRPYFVMELVKGVPITEYCDARKLTPKERLELFIPVCQAIQHAHQKGIIHRDIKPSNVLVALYDDRPVVKIIDFGVAKATGGTLTEHTIETGFGGVVGTPQYMSPEQATLNNLDIDTRSDVYALGILLYELLTGSPPFSKADLEKRGLLEMLRVVREEEPPRPSTKLSTADALPSLSANRGMEPRKLTGLLRHELDWIVMKALEKDRARRYDTASNFAADVQRYLTGDPVLAHPPSLSYRFAKFVRRHRAQVLAASLILLALVAGVIGTSLGLRAAQQQAAVALQAEAKEREAKIEVEKKRQEAESKRQEAERNLQFARKGNEILGSIFIGIDPKANFATVGEFSTALKKKLNHAVKELDGAAIGDPLAVAQMQDTLGQSLFGLGDYPQAVKLLEKARETRQARLGADHPLTLATMGSLATAYNVSGKLELSRELYEETLKRRKSVLGADHPETLTAANNLAILYNETGKHALARPLLEETLRKRKALFGAADADTLNTMAQLGHTYELSGQIAKALPLLEEALRLEETHLGHDHPHTLAARNNLSLVYRSAERHGEALKLAEMNLPLMKNRLGLDHPTTLSGMDSLATMYLSGSKLDQAIPLFEATLRQKRITLGANHPGTLVGINNLASAYWMAKKLDKSVPLFEELLPLQRSALGSDHLNTLKTMANLGVNYKSIGKVAEAIPYLEEAYSHAPKQPAIVWAGLELVDAYSHTGKRDAALQLAQKLTTQTRATHPQNSLPLASQFTSLGLHLCDLSAFTDAESVLREALTIREKQMPNAWNTFSSMSLLGRALLGQEKYADAEPFLLKGYAGLKEREQQIPPQGNRIPQILDALIELYTATDKPAEVEKYQALRAKYPEK